MLENEHLNKPDILKSLRPERLYTQVLKEQADVTVKLLMIMFAR